MSIFSIAICDDEPEACSSVSDILAKHRDASNFEVEIFHSGEALLEHIKKEQTIFNLVILDIRLYKLDGVEVGHLLRKSAQGQYTSILYISGDQSYAMQLFNVRPINFLLKPLNEEKLLKCIDTAIEQLQPPTHTFSYLKDKSIFAVRCVDILYFELMSKTVIIHTTDGSNPRFYGDMEDVLRQVGYQQNFLQTHCSFLVNWNHVCKVFPDEVELTNGELIRVTRTFKKSVKAFAKTKMGRN